MVGFVGAQSIGEPVTQTNLKSFHKSGTGKTVSGGLVRVKELLSVTKKYQNSNYRNYLGRSIQKWIKLSLVKLHHI